MCVCVFVHVGICGVSRNAFNNVAIRHVRFEHLTYITRILLTTNHTNDPTLLTATASQSCHTALDAMRTAALTTCSVGALCWLAGLAGIHKFIRMFGGSAELFRELMLPFTSLLFCVCVCVCTPFVCFVDWLC